MHQHKHHITGYIARYRWIERTLTGGVALNCAEIAERLGVSQKTAQRYINRMRVEGYRLEYDHRLDGYVVIDQPRRPDPSPTTDLIRMLRRAVTWARRRENQPRDGYPIPWLAEAEKVLDDGLAAMSSAARDRPRAHQP